MGILDSFLSIFVRRGFFWRQALETQGLLPDALAKAFPHVVVVGEGGAGKSTLLKQMLAQQAARGRVPVWVSLAALPTEGPLTLSTLIDHLCEHARTHLGVEEAGPAFFEALVRDGALTIGFDALDECGSLAQRQKVRGLIVEVAREWKRCRVYVTARPDALRDTPLPMASVGRALEEGEFLGLMPTPFERHDIEPFLKAAFDDGEQLAQKLLGRTGIEALLETPLTLMLVGLVARTAKGGLPETRTPLFARCLDTVVETWEDAKGAPAADGLNPAQRLDVLRRLGWEAQRAGGDALGARAARAALAKVPDVASPVRAKAVVDGLARRNLLLRAETAGDGAIEVTSIRFSHPQFREYLAGAHLAEQFSIDSAAAAGEMAPHWFDTGWLEVLRFAVATLENDAALRDGLLRAILAADDPYADLLRRGDLLVARLLARLPSADVGLVEGVVACLEKTALEEPALRDVAAQALLGLARHKPARPAIERFARGAGVARAFPDDEQQSEAVRMEALRWRLRAIETLASSDKAAALQLLARLPAAELAAALEVCDLRARLGDRDVARATWRQRFDDAAADRRMIAAAMDKAGEGERFDAWLLAELGIATARDALLARERDILKDHDVPVWTLLFERALALLDAMNPQQDSAPDEVSSAVYAALETGAGAASPAGHSLVAAALRQPSLVWFAGPRAGKAMPALAAEAVQRLVAYVLDAPQRTDGSRLNAAVHALSEEPDDALAVPALLELLRRFDPHGYWAHGVAESLRRRGQAEAGLSALAPRLALPPGSDDHHPDAGASARSQAWQLARTLDPARTVQLLDEMYRSGEPEDDAQRLMQAWNASGVGAVAREWFAAVKLDEPEERARRFLHTLATHEQDTDFTDDARHALYGAVFARDQAERPQAWSLADAEHAFERALAQGWFFDERDRKQKATTDSVLGLLSSIASLSEPATALRYADAWVRRTLDDADVPPEERSNELADRLHGLADRGLRDARWIEPLVAYARTLASTARRGLVEWLSANA